MAFTLFTNPTRTFCLYIIYKYYYELWPLHYLQTLPRTLTFTLFRNPKKIFGLPHYLQTLRWPLAFTLFTNPTRTSCIVYLTLRRPVMLTLLRPASILFFTFFYFKEISMWSECYGSLHGLGVPRCMTLQTTNLLPWMNQITCPLVSDAPLAPPSRFNRTVEQHSHIAATSSGLSGGCHTDPPPQWGPAHWHPPLTPVFRFELIYGWFVKLTKMSRLFKADSTAQNWLTLEHTNVKW